MKLFVVIILLFHGLIHSMGFVKSIYPGRIKELKQKISLPLGIIWLVTTILFVMSSVFLFMDSVDWWIIAGTGVIVSQILIAKSWADAKFGTVPNIIIASLIIFLEVSF